MLEEIITTVCAMRNRGVDPNSVLKNVMECTLDFNNPAQVMDVITQFMTVAEEEASESASHQGSDPFGVNT